MITLPSLKGGKYHPGTEGARLPVNCSLGSQAIPAPQPTAASLGLMATSSNPRYLVPRAQELAPGFCVPKGPNAILFLCTSHTMLHFL